MEEELTHGSLFSGVEGFGLGAAFAGIKTLWSCEYEDYQANIIKKNFGEEHEINRDIKTYSKPTFVDIISGGFPCQDISIAGKGVGIVGERSGLWNEMFRIIREIRPKYIIIENSPMLLVRGFERVLCNLSEIGYDAEWQCLSGTDFGIQQGRERLYCIAYPPRNRQQTERARIGISEALPIGAIYTSISGMENKTVNTLTPICWKV
jgi:DNA (cytosine-5)-methyltransferase 1